MNFKEELNADRIIATKSPAETLKLLQELLTLLEDEASRCAACTQLHKLAELLQLGSDDNAQLFIKELKVPGVSEPIKVLLNPAVFSPELWGRTFAEGLLKDPEYFHGKKVLELGTGSGWVSLLLLQKTSVREVLGLDINPVAVTLANLNKWLNGSSPDGKLKNSLAGIPLVEAFKAEVSDLLQTPLKRQECFDRIIGCIPQVLHPVPEKGKETTQDLSYQDLYDLSNYCFNQGILEDRFGLPLIARALEESQLCLNPQGSLTLILGGRPGQEAIEEMFRRRGYKPHLTWVRRIQQADDTDLVQLVKLEEVFNIKFHFFVSPNSKQSIPAGTAVGLKDRSERIYHDLLVYRAETVHEKPTLSFLRNLHKLGLDSLRKELDLSRVSDEQISFLERLSEDLLKEKSIPYPHEKGDLNFRAKLAKFLAFYCHYQASPEDLFVGPERAQLLSLILKMLGRGGDRILLSSSLEPLYGEICKREGLELVLGNSDLSELLALDDVFQPKICVISPYQLRDPSPLVLDSLIKQAEDNPERCYLIDDSEHFEIGSQIQSNILLRLLGQKKIPGNLVFLYGLIKNTVCPDFELSFLINAPSSWIEGLEYGAELSYSRISYIVQLYYEWLFDELLSFPFVESATEGRTDKAGSGIAPSPQFARVCQDPVFAPKPISLDTPDLIRMDYGEFEYEVPDLLVKGLLKGFLETRSDSLEHIVQERVTAYVRRTRHANVNADTVVLGQGVFPLVAALIQCLKDSLGRAPKVAVPEGSYGPVFPLLEYYGAQLILVPTDPANAFLPTAEHISKLSPTPDLLYISQPSNPAGVFLEAETVRKIQKVCDEKGIYVFADEIFFLLSDSALGNWTPAELSFAYGSQSKEHRRLFFADGLAKSFAAGGLRCGFIVCPDESWARKLRTYSWAVPQAVLRSWDRLYSAFLEEAPIQLIDGREEFNEMHSYLLEARSNLSDKRQRVLSLLSKHGLSDGLKYARRGGLFTLAKLAKSSPELAKEEHLLLNTDAWARSKDWARVCFSISDGKFNEAIRRLENFLNRQ